MADPEFRRDLYRGSAADYDRFRVPYPRRLIDDLARRTGADGSGLLLDLACGTGQLSFALRRHFDQVWAVDQEPDMIRVAAQKARAAGIGGMRCITAAAEDLTAAEESFDLITIGNAFHRLRRDVVAVNARRWLRPGQYLALVWSDGPWAGHAAWQLALAAAMERWQIRAGARQRVLAGYRRDRRDRPDLDVIRDAGLEPAGNYDFPAEHEWTPEALVGFVFSTSVLSRAVLGDLSAEFAADLRAELLGTEPEGRLRQTINFAYELARRPVTP